MSVQVAQVRKMKFEIKTMKMEMTENIPPELNGMMLRGLEEYSKSNGVDTNYKCFSLVLRGDGEEVVGIIGGYTIFTEIHVSDLWISSSFRGKGYGRELMRELERQFEGKGFWNINLCTSEFQAPEFYKKCGFETEFVRRNRQYPKLTKHFFIKYFQSNEQTQGISK
jgi:ribosomal protein S18 acetylase RimI-like enzyme